MIRFINLKYKQTKKKEKKPMHFHLNCTINKTLDEWHFVSYSVARRYHDNIRVIDVAEYLLCERIYSCETVTREEFLSHES